VLLLFASAREAAGVGKERVAAATVGEAIESARARHGIRFSEIVDRSRIWLNGEPVDSDQALRDGRPSVLVVGGLVWAVLLIGGVSLGEWTAALVVAPVAMVATASVAPKRRPVPAPVLAGLTASVVLPLAAILGPAAAIAVAALAAATMATLILLNPKAAPDPARLLVGALGPGVAAMSVVLARGQGINEAMTLVAALCAYDMAAFLMGNGRSALGGPIGAIAGWVSIGVIGIYATAVMNPPFTGSRTIVLFGLTAVLASAGVLLGTWLSGPARLPAVRRLDSFLLAAPAWVLGVAFLLHR
jgi:molybdopterin synthase sulfur carrier subunit